MKEFIIKTAWTHGFRPAIYSAFHICIMAAGFSLPVLAAYFLSGKTERKFFIRLLFFCGVILAASEIYKQLFLYYVVNQEIRLVVFPFQLCSLPMYFCLLLPLVKNRRLQLIILTFMQDFNLLGGIMALAGPSGLLHPYWFLTLHGLLWHILLIFIGLLIGFSHESDSSFTSYIRTLPLFPALLRDRHTD